MSTTKHSYSLKSRRLTRILKERTLLLYEYRFAAIMDKYPKWVNGDAPTYFPHQD